jgi:ssDNA-binding Zn-finger/Zn-ribbon topoisomerase 1
MEDNKLPELQSKVCKSCGKIKLRIRDGDYNHKDKRWRDSDGQLWNGLTCPICHKDKMILKMRKLRSDRNKNETKEDA